MKNLFTKMLRLAGLLTSAFVVVLTFAANAPAQETKLLLIRQNNLWGYADRDGRIVITPRYEAADQFSEGLAAVRIQNKWGYINEKNVPVIPTRFDSADRFSGGLAAVELNQKFGYVNREGALVIPAQYDRAKAFSNGLAVVKNGVEWLVINPEGGVVLKPSYDIVESFSEGLAAVKGQGGWGYIDRTGVLKIPLKFARAGRFSGQLAPARLEANSPVGFINPAGSFVIQPKYREAHAFANGLAAVQIDKAWGFIDKSGELRIQPRFVLASQFVHVRHDQKERETDFAQVVDRIYGRTFYLDRSGQIAFEMSDKAQTGVGGWRLVPLEIKSTPSGARVYLIPRDDWDSNPQIINDDQKLNSYRPKTGDTTPVTTDVYEQVLIIVYNLNGKRGWKLVDVIGPNKNEVGITPE